MVGRKQMGYSDGVIPAWVWYAYQDAVRTLTHWGRDPGALVLKSIEREPGFGPASEAKYRFEFAVDASNSIVFDVVVNELLLPPSSTPASSAAPPRTLPL